MNLHDFSEIFQDSSAGDAYGNDGHLTVIGWDSMSNRTKRFVFNCSMCATDPELYGEGYFTGFKSNIKNGALPCGCAGYKLWTEDQQKSGLAEEQNNSGITL